MKELYTLGRWTIYAEPETDGGVNFYTGPDSYDIDFVTRGYIRTSWGRPSIRKAWNKVLKKLNNQHALDSECLAGMKMAKDIAKNHLSES